MRWSLQRLLHTFGFFLRRRRRPSLHTATEQPSTHISVFDFISPGPGPGPNASRRKIKTYECRARDIIVLYQKCLFHFCFVSCLSVGTFGGATGDTRERWKKEMHLIIVILRNINVSRIGMNFECAPLRATELTPGEWVRDWPQQRLQTRDAMDYTIAARMQNK